MPAAGTGSKGRKHSNSQRAWQRMLSGRRLDLIEPSPLDIEIEDIAHGLARVARWNGQTKGAHAFSVAQHSLLVLEVHRTLDPDLSAENRLYCLLHDAPEYVIGDMISPFKAVMGGDYKVIEARLQAAIHLRFGLSAKAPASLKREIKRADTIAAYFEATMLAGFTVSEARTFFGQPENIDHTRLAIDPLPAEMAQSAFLECFHAIDQSRSGAQSGVT